MFVIDVTCLINRPLPAVFAYVADFSNAPAWQRQLSAVRLPDGPFPTGRTVTEIHHFLGVRIEATGHLVDWHPLDTFTVRGRSGLIEVESRYAFAEEDGGTRVSLTLTMSPRGPARLGEPFLRRQLGRDLNAAFTLLPRSCQDAVPETG